MTTPVDVVDLKGNIYGCTICPLSFVAIVLITLEINRARCSSHLPPAQRTKKARSE